MAVKFHFKHQYFLTRNKKLEEVNNELLKCVRFYLNINKKGEQKSSTLSKEDANFSIHLINKYNLHRSLPLSKICVNLAESNFLDTLYNLIG